MRGTVPSRASASLRSATTASASASAMPSSVLTSRVTRTSSSSNISAVPAQHVASSTAALRTSGGHHNNNNNNSPILASPYTLVRASSVPPPSMPDPPPSISRSPPSSPRTTSHLRGSAPLRPPTCVRSVTPTPQLLQASSTGNTLHHPVTTHTITPHPVTPSKTHPGNTTASNGNLLRAPSKQGSPPASRSSAVNPPGRATSPKSSTSAASATTSTPSNPSTTEPANPEAEMKRNIEILVNYIREAIESKKKGDSTRYRVIVTQLLRGQPDALVLWLKALKNCALLITPEDHYELQTAIFKTSFASDRTVVDELIECCLNLVTSHTGHLTPMIRMLLSNLYPKKASKEDKTYDIELSQRVAEIVRVAISRLIALVPLSSIQLSNDIPKHFPLISVDGVAHMHFLQNLFQVLEVAPNLCEPVIMTAVHKMLQLDVLIKLLPEEEDDHSKELVFALDVQPAEGQDENAAENQQTADKLDSLMDVFFSFLKKVLPANDQNSHNVFSILLKAFTKFILPTYRSKYVQFIMFVACSLDPSYANTFLQHLLNSIITDTKVPDLFKSMYCSYLASFVARAAYLPRSVVQKTLETLIDWAIEYAEGHGPSTQVGAHTLYYLVTQSVFYIFCFTYSKFLSPLTKKAQRDIFMTMGFEELCHSPLRPLSVCNDSVGGEFLTTVAHLKLCNSASLKEYLLPSPQMLQMLQEEQKLAFQIGTQQALSEVNIISTVAAASASALPRQLQPELNFFPFDPYLLKTSHTHVKDIYNSWHQCEGDEEGQNGALSGGSGEEDVLVGSLNELDVSDLLEKSGTPRSYPAQLEMMEADDEGGEEEGRGAENEQGDEESEEEFEATGCQPVLSPIPIQATIKREIKSESESESEEEKVYIPRTPSRSQSRNAVVVKKEIKREEEEEEEEEQFHANHVTSTTTTTSARRRPSTVKIKKEKFDSDYSSDSDDCVVNFRS
ncbi:RNA polymerase I-specific transcription initiation factor RRN3 [Pelomyxa schiedti]|nr:RNA polymerase I-specific transcription initiation factor RRN3 [Pelomyxa schiedti]